MTRMRLEIPSCWLVRPAAGSKRGKDFQPLSVIGVLTLLRQARASNALTATKIQDRLARGIKDYVVPAISDSVADQKETKLQEVFVAWYRSRKPATIEFAKQMHDFMMS